MTMPHFREDDRMKKLIYLIQPTYRDNSGKLLKGKRLYAISLALPAVSGTLPADWKREICYEYFEDVNFDTEATVIGISSMGYEIFRGIEIADEFRRRGKIVLFGGFQPHISTPFVAPHCDAVIHGNPGKADMASILDDIESRRLKKEYHCGADLNYRVDYSVVDPQRTYFMPVFTSVGCRNHCGYCCVASLYRGKYELRHLFHVIDELDALRRTTRRIAFVDTNIYNNRSYLQRLCRVMISRNYNFVWGAQCTVDIGDDPETLALLKLAGCRILFIGMESITQENLDEMEKRYRVDSYRRKIETIHRAGIKIASFFIYGMDGDTRETSAQLSQFIIQNRIALPMINILVPTPATPLYERLKREGRILMNDEQDFLRNNIAYNSSFSLCFYKPKNMTPDEVEEGFLDLLGRLSGYHQLLRRSLSTDISLTLFLLAMNWLFRKEYVELKRRRRARSMSNAQPAHSSHHEQERYGTP
jgi:radical SAM superfamily enzyme YgiQ (UPF0313 family)